MAKGEQGVKYEVGDRVWTVTNVVVTITKLHGEDYADVRFDEGDSAFVRLADVRPLDGVR